MDDLTPGDSHRNGKAAAKVERRGVPGYDAHVYGFAKDIPYSLAVAFWNCRDLLSEWRDACISVERRSVDAFADQFRRTARLLFGKSGVFTLLRGSRSRSNNGAEQGTFRAVDYAADEFAVVADGVARWKNFCESSTHKLVVDVCASWLTAIRRTICLKDGEANLPLRGSETVQLKRHFRTVSGLMKRGFYLSVREFQELRANLFQEVSRACDRRLITKRRYPGDDRRYDPRSSGRLSDAERDILEVITAAEHRLVTKEVLALLEKKNGTASEGTTKINLAGLVRREILTNRSDMTPRGYGLPEWD